MEVGVEEMLRVLEPSDVLVHGYMPEKVFGRFYQYAKFHWIKAKAMSPR